MLDQILERLRTHQKNAGRYRKLFATRLTDLERAYIEHRLSEEQACVKALLRESFPDRLAAGLPTTKGRTKFELPALLHPADAFDHPLDVVDDCDLTSYEKRAILSSWAADACAVPEPGQRVQDTAVSFDEILDALHLVESEREPSADHSQGSSRHCRAQRSRHPLL